MAQRHKNSQEGGDAPGRRRRGLGVLGLRALDESVPELTLVPLRDGFRPGDVAELCDLAPAQLKALGRNFPELQPRRNGKVYSYSRLQVEQLLRVKRLYLEQRLPLDQVRQRLAAVQPLSAALAARSRALPTPRWPAPGAPAMASALPAPGEAMHLRDALAMLRAELQAILDLCNAPD